MVQPELARRPVPVRAPRPPIAAGIMVVAAAAIVAGGAVSGGSPDPREGQHVAAAMARAVARAGGHSFDALERGTLPERPDAPRTGPGMNPEAPLGAPRRPFGRVPTAAPRIAVVFDDLGYTTSGLAGELLDIDAPLTFAVLPGLAHSVEFAEAARRRGHDVLLHLPMEPLDAVRHDPGRGAVRAGLSAGENARRVVVSLAALPEFVGVSNHMGSRVTASAELMDLVLAEVKRRGQPLFFLDSRTTPRSVVPERARRAGVPVFSNDLFLDGADEHVVLPEVQTERLEAIARHRGSAIGIGHVRPETVAAVRAAVERWQAEGIRLVRVSELGNREPAAVERPFARR